ncbi:MAG: ABC transporter permease [Thermomicrobiales bacterium]|nr:ABC transporter permease [Thermomicrobiales bacterium]
MTEATASSAAARPGRLTEFWRYFRENRGAVIGLWVFVVLVALALLADVIAPWSPTAQMRDSTLLPPAWTAGGTWAHPLGTDPLGRDLWSRLLYGARLTLTVGIAGAAVSAAVGLLIGLIAGYFGGWVDAVTMRGLDVLLSFPDILLAVVIVAILGPSLQNALIAVAILGVPFYVRLIRADVLRLRQSDFVTSARTIGASNRRIIAAHILPNVIAPIIVTASIHVGYLILSAAGLSFVGLGAQPPSPEWGAMVSSGRDYLLIAPHVVLVPAAAIFVVVLAFNIVGDGLRDALDPKAR